MALFANKTHYDPQLSLIFFKLVLPSNPRKGLAILCHGIIIISSSNCSAAIIRVWSAYLRLCIRLAAVPLP